MDIILHSPQGDGSHTQIEPPRSASKEFLATSESISYHATAGGVKTSRGRVQPLRSNSHTYGTCKSVVPLSRGDYGTGHESQPR